LDDGTALLPEPVSDTAETIVIPRKKSKLSWVFIGIAGVLIILIGAGWLFLRSTFETRDLPRTTANTSATPAQTPPTPALATPSPGPALTQDANANSNTDTVSNSKSVELNDPTKQTPIMKTEDHSVQFNLHQCRKSGSAITCDFTFQNKGPDRRFEFVVHRSNLYDELGNGYSGQKGQLANYEGNQPRIAFVSGVTTRAQITFDGIDPNAAKITVLRIQFDVGDDNGLEVKFRNVPLIIAK
jgi:flagellar basal body-associated protein FliL